MTSSHPANLPPIPIADPHVRIMNHEDLSATDVLDVERNMMEDADSFAAWSEEIKHLHELPTPEPEDERNHETLARLIDRPPALLSCEPAEEADNVEGPQLVEVGALLTSLGQKAEKSQRIYDVVADRAEIEATEEYKIVHRQLKGPKVKLSDNEIYDIYKDQILGPQQTEAMAAVDGDLTKLAEILKQHPDQWRYVRHAGNIREQNVTDAHTHLTTRESKTVEAENTDRIMATTRPTLTPDGTNPDGTPKFRADYTDVVPIGSLERATAAVGVRDARTHQEIAGHLHGFTDRAAVNFRGFIRALEAKGAIPDEGAALVVEKFQKDFEVANSYKIEDAVTELEEGIAFKELLNADTEEDRAKAEQPLWRDIAYTGRALDQANKLLTDMRNAGVSAKHSHYRALYQKAKEIEQTHVRSWQQWQNLRITRAAIENIVKPDFKGRIPAVMYLKDNDKGLYVIPPRGQGTTIVYPDSSVRNITVDPATGAPITHDRVYLNGNEWKSNPMSLEYENAQPLASTMGVVGRVSLGAYNSLAPTEKHVDSRDIVTLVEDLRAGEYEWRMHPSDPTVVQEFYRHNRLIEQRVAESIAEIRGDGSTPLTVAQENSVTNLHIVATQAQYRIRYMEHGSEGDDSTMNRDGAITFTGMLHGQPGNWTLLPSGYAWKEEITRKPDGSREVGHVLYSPDGTEY